MSSRTATAARVLLWALTALTLAAVVLELGAWTRRRELSGPFEREGSPGSRAFFVQIDERVPLSCCLEVRSDNPDHPDQSDLTLRINGQPMGPPHTPHVYIRRGGTTGFSHWSGYLYFVPPDGAQSIHAFVEYSVRPTRLMLSLLIAASLSLGLVLYRQSAVAFAAGRGHAVVNGAIAAPYWIAHGLGYLLLAGVTTFLGVTAYASFTGWALPTTALIRWSSTARWLAAREPWLGQLAVGFAAIGALATWIAVLLRGGQDVIDREEARLLRFARLACLPIVAGCLLFSLSAMWSGMVRPGDLQGSAIGGLISFSDASNYLGEAYDQARDGFWRSITLRRPIAGAFRSLLLLVGGYSVPWMLVAQTVALAGALCFACWAIARWRGVWAALAFFGLSYTYLRSFAPTTLTEPLGLTWGFISIACFVSALAVRSRAFAAAGLAATACSLMTRMGSMFAVPALIAWIALRRGEQKRAQAGALAAAAVVAVVLLSLILSKLYTGGQEVTGSNFSYTACGLAIGTDWTGCPARYEAAGHPLPDDVQIRDKLLYRMALENVESHPGVLIHRLLAGVHTFVDELPNVAWRGYEGAVLEPSWFPSTSLTWLGLVAVGAVLYRRREPGELSFWIWMFAAILVSAPFVYFDDGRRVLATSYAFVYLFFATGFSRPTRVTATTMRDVPGRTLAIAGAAAAAALVLTPVVSHLVYPRVAPRVGDVAKDTSPYQVWGHRVTGFVVVADDAPLSGAVPAVHASDFARMIAAVEGYQGVVHPQSPPLPFAFVYAPRLPRKTQSEFDYIAPPAVLERRDVAVWSLDAEDWHRPLHHAAYWYRVTNAVAVR